MIEVQWKFAKRIHTLVEQVKKLDNQEIDIGYFDKQGVHPESPNVNFPTLMAMHELSSGMVLPKRPVFQQAVKKNGAKFEKDYRDSIKKYVILAGSGKPRSPANLLTKIGEDAVDMIKPVFGDKNLLKPNTAATAARKGSNKPMIEFGILKESLAIRHTLRKSLKTSR